MRACAAGLRPTTAQGAQRRENRFGSRPEILVSSTVAPAPAAAACAATRGGPVGAGLSDRPDTGRRAFRRESVVRRTGRSNANRGTSVRASPLVLSWRPPCGSRGSVSALDPPVRGGTPMSLPDGGRMSTRIFLPTARRSETAHEWTRRSGPLGDASQSQQIRTGGCGALWRGRGSIPVPCPVYAHPWPAGTRRLAPIGAGRRRAGSGGSCPRGGEMKAIRARLTLAQGAVWDAKHTLERYGG